jgi:hypothetical protein
MPYKKVIEIAEVDIGFWLTIQYVNPETRQVEKIERVSVLTKEGAKKWLEEKLI